MDQYLSPKAVGITLRPLKWLRNAGLAFCAFGGLYTLYLSLQDKDYTHVGGYIFWIVVGAVPLTCFCLKLRRRIHARHVAGKIYNYSGVEVPLRWLYNSVRKLRSGSAYAGH